MIIKELFEGPVGDYCIAHNTTKCLLIQDLALNLLSCTVFVKQRLVNKFILTNILS